jgi:hypothetical protein
LRPPSGFWGAAGKGGKRAARRTVQTSTDKRRPRRILPPAASGTGGAGLRPAGAGAGPERDGQVFFAAAGKSDKHELFLELERMRERMRRLERREDAFGAGKPAKRGECLVVGCAHVFRAARIA